MISSIHARFLFCSFLATLAFTPPLAAQESEKPAAAHGLVGLRPLPRTAADHQTNHGGSWAGTPTYDQQDGQYPYVARHLDVVKGWLEGDFKTKRMFFEHYWGLSEARDSPDPQKNLLIKTIQRWESQGAEIEHILICREYRLAIQRGHDQARPGPFPEDTRLLYEKDVDLIRTLFKQAHSADLIQHDNYKLIQMVEHPTFFAQDKRVHPIIAKMDGVCYEAHQFNRHWPLRTGWSKPEKVAVGARWTIQQNQEYIFYFGPIIWKGPKYREGIERDWMRAFWEAGLPKHHPKMHHYLNLFPHGSGRGRPVGPESDPHSILGFTKWMIKEIKQPGLPKE